MAWEESFDASNGIYLAPLYSSFPLKRKQILLSMDDYGGILDEAL
jgi:hypothetical protein